MIKELTGEEKKKEERKWRGDGWGWCPGSSRGRRREREREREKRDGWLTWVCKELRAAETDWIERTTWTGLQRDRRERRPVRARCYRSPYISLSSTSTFPHVHVDSWPRAPQLRLNYASITPSPSHQALLDPNALQLIYVLDNHSPAISFLKPRLLIN